MDKIGLDKKITLKYISALIFIAILSTISFYVLYKSLQSSKFTAYIVNISGQQRMLSQRISLDVHRIHNSFIDTKNSSLRMNDIIKNLLTHTKEMKNNNKILSSGILPNGREITLSKQIHDIYFGSMNLKKRVDEYVEIAREITKATKHTKIDNILIDIDSRSEQLLIDLNKAVRQYQVEGEKKLYILEILEIIAWILVIITLFMEIIFVFKPMLKSLILIISQNEKTLENLENEVELRTKANCKLKKMVCHDPMTGLKNRLTLESDIEKSIEHYNEHKAPFAILMFDIDFFKDVNDKYGHDIGDIVIKGIANILSSSVREEDDVYRAGGEEFVILLNRITFDDTVKIAQKIKLLIEKHTFMAENIKFFKTISGGLYHSSICSNKSVADVLKLADKALYESKKNGRNMITNACAS